MRLGRLGILSALLFAGALEGAAFAQGTPSAATDPSRKPTINAINTNRAADGNKGIAKDGSRVGPKTVNPTYGPNGPGPYSGWERTHQPPEIWARNSRPIIAERPDAPGKFYDARPDGQRTTGTINKDVAAAELERLKYYDNKNSVNLYDWQTDPDKNKVAVGSGEAGKYDRAKENGAQIGACVLCADAKAGATLGVTSEGVQASANFEAGAYLAKVDGNFDAKYRGDVVQGGVSGEGSAFVGVQAKGTGTVEISKERIGVNGKLEAFAGGKAEGQVTAEAGLTNVGTVKGTVMGEVSYGIGASAEGYFNVDWKTFTISTGGRASATLGVGAGVGFQTEISVKPAVDWTVGKAKEGYAAVSSGVSTAASAVSSSASYVANKLCFWCDDPPKANPPMPPQQQISTGVQTPLNANTGPTAVLASQGILPTNVKPAGNANAASGAGTSGALGR